MRSPKMSGSAVRRAGFAVAYLALCAGGTVGAVEFGTEVGSRAADLTALRTMSQPMVVEATAPTAGTGVVMVWRGTEGATGPTR